MKKIIAIIVPHGDDESLGFGGVIQQHIAANDEVHVVFCRSPLDERTQKQLNDTVASKQILKYQHIHYLYVTETEISNEPLTLFRKIENILKQINPNVVYTTFWGDIHQDHRITFDCVCRAVRVWGPQKITEFYVGEIPSSTDQYPTICGTSFTPNLYVPITKDELEVKIRSLEAYGTEVKYNNHPRSRTGLEQRAAIRGQECGHEYAEAFIVVRTIAKI
jgi:LmbE family N-acetylglucosaminyl deacetylase